jgi:hypothetical protein
MQPVTQNVGPGLPLSIVTTGTRRMMMSRIPEMSMVRLEVLVMTSSDSSRLGEVLARV